VNTVALVSVVLAAKRQHLVNIVDVVDIRVIGLNLVPVNTVCRRPLDEIVV
jgi:hypothetical protein